MTGFAGLATGTLAVGVLAVGLVAAAGPSPAAADPADGAADSGEIVLYREPGFTPPLFDVDTDMDSYAGAYFVNSVIPLDNAAGSVANHDLDRTVRLYAEPNGSGPSRRLLRFGQFSGSLAWRYAALDRLAEDVSSHRFGR